MELKDLYALAEAKGVRIMDFSLPENKAVTLKIAENCYIGVDPAVFGRECEERIIIAHEMGHIATGGFYTEDTDEEYRKKQELKAEKWAMEHLVPKTALKNAIKNGCHSLESMAEHFCVNEEYMSKVLLYYLDN
ncbi:MAG: ImmA/IrrE family metallo-endopeptidase [Clostridia bacterium]|nr:ImmA/IrrE family metallo-endopeptidase [Clostridia bacterium]